MAADESANTLVIGANHRSASLTLRDQLFVEDEAAPEFLTGLRNAGIGQAMVMSTCDRVEVQAIDDDHASASRCIAEIMAAHGELTPGDLDGQLYTMSGAEAVRHIFTVAASLDSLVIGEPHVFGQMKASHRLSRDVGMSGGELEAVLQAAYSTAKRVRTETGVGERPVSIASAATELARQLHGDLDGRSALLIGTGDMGQTIVESLVSGGLRNVVVVHPTDSRAEAVARSLDCHVGGFSDLAQLLARSDIAVAAYGGRRHVLTAELVGAALKARRNRPMFVVDAGIPGDIEPSVDRFDNAFLYGLDDLEGVAMEGRASREGEADAARRIIEDELDKFLRGRAERAAAPAVTALRQQFEAARLRALEDAGGDAEKATRLLVNRLLHAPSEALRGLASSRSGEEDLETAKRLLGRLFPRDGSETDNEE